MGFAQKLSYDKIKRMKTKTLKIGILPIKFLKQVQTELKKVKWPTQKEVARMTAIVLGVSTVIGLFLSSIDLVFTRLFEIYVRTKTKPIAKS